MVTVDNTQYDRIFFLERKKKNVGCRAGSVANAINSHLCDEGSIIFK